ncbi:T9SS type A sorting domain-containing protein [Sanyastnella coralliicola]|uniref:T9SS type A sorting domain-containing protein n=1 Tax=Sanyastnella coralliicola TaxID=3069118 RepID=UPI0027BB1985|nr:T9SS type A sorting domain-containing protein [Longitalea sp. SCSIO 12813]
MSKQLRSKLILLVCACVFVSTANAQDSMPIAEEVRYTQCVKFWEIPALKDLAEQHKNEPIAAPIKAPERKAWEAEIDQENALPQNGDPVRQTVYGTRSGATSWVNKPGMGGGFPPDPTGAAGPNHFVQAVNTSYRAYNLEGTPVMSSLNLNNLWPGEENLGDPIVMYDEFADRWFISQFKSNGILIAISQTPDPEGEFYGYEFNLAQFPDYPKYSVWSDAYYMTANAFVDNAVAFERDKMLAGDPSAGMIDMNFPNVPNGGFRSPLPADADGDLPPLGTPNYMFTLADDAWSGVSDDHIKVIEMDIDWDNPNNSTIQVVSEIETSAYDCVFTGPWNDIEQPNTNQRLDAVAMIFYYRAQYRRWVGYNTMVLCHVVDLGGLQAGIRWYELRDNDDGNWYLYQEGTFAPDDDESRFMASIAMDNQGNIGMAYSISGPNEFPGLRFTGRMADDPLGQMTYEEQVIIDGSGFQSGGNRYGDYAHMSVYGSRFWFTGEYLQNGSRRTRIFSFDLDGSTDINDLSGSDIDTQVYLSDPSTLQVKASNLPNSEEIVLDLFDIRGAIVSHDVLTPANAGFQRSLNVDGLAPGMYMVRFGNGKYQEVKKVQIN